ncbi:MAG TPA: hypothetical protein VK040_04300 [Balneolaceae bacterium]|nr:hypothetical protein [Balneolaceae bacterium]
MLINSKQVLTLDYSRGRDGQQNRPKELSPFYSRGDLHLLF